MLTLERAKELNDAVVTEDHLRLHALNVMAAMGAMAEHFDMASLKAMCESYAAEGISPGGAADMLALTIFMDSILN